MTRSQRRSLLAGVAALIGALTIAACGGGSSPDAKSGGPSRGYADALRFSVCMRSHGVSGFPDPSTGGGGIHLRIGSGTGVDPFSPAFKSAQAACRHLLPGGGPGNGRPSPQARAQMLAISTCMRAHGITDFPDPTTTQPSEVPGNNSIVLGRDGVFLAVPSTINVNSPAFKQAASACRFG